MLPAEGRAAPITAPGIAAELTDHEVLHDHLKRFQRVGAGLRHVAELPGGGAKRTFEYGQDEIILALEPFIERAPGKPRAREYGADRQPFQALFFQKVRRRVEQHVRAVAPVGRFGAFRTKWRDRVFHRGKS